jgi:predicted negative regulator of RcsB-dependent stress response
MITEAEFMAYDLEEQEQIDAIKGWWGEYGKLVILGAIAVLVTIAAFQGWRYYRAQQAERAATLFMQLDEAERASDSKRVRDIAAQIIDRHGATQYAALAAFAAAKAGVTTGEIEDAKKNLQWAVDHAKDEDMRDVARLRLAGILLDEKKYDEALKLLSTKAAESYAMLYADLRGDVLAAAGKPAEARTAYQLALDKSEPNSSYRRLIEVKLDALGEAK